MASRVMKTASRQRVSEAAEFHDVSLGTSASAISGTWRIPSSTGERPAEQCRRVLHTHRLSRSSLHEGGFFLNGQHVKLRGLNRHQTYPYVGGAMPARVQARDAIVLRKELKCNIVRTSHYPQSPHFLDACDEVGLLVLEEIPGWQLIGDKAWQDLAVDNVGRMIRRDWNHPSIVLWGVRINESPDNHDFYARTNQAGARARRLAPDRRHPQQLQLRAARRRLHHERFRFPAAAAEPSAYLNTEFNGHMYSTKRFDNVERVAEHVIRHARVHDQLAGDDHYAGGIGVVRLRLRLAQLFRLGRPHLLSRRERHLPPAEAGGGILPVAVRARRGSRDRAGLFLRLGR